MNKTTTLFLTITTLLAFIPSLFALEVDINELRTRRVEFTNYTGPSPRSDSVKNVKSIGSGLAAGADRAGAGSSYNIALKYSIIRALSKNEPSLLSADIISIDRDARVSHIQFVRRIVEGYLETMYGYSQKQSRTISLFVTYYNAVYRGNLDYFGSKYKKIVLTHINTKNAGISTKYFEWPGATKLIIPLTENSLRGSISSVDPFAISDENVRRNIRKDEAAISERKELAEMKERNLQSEKEKLGSQKKGLSAARSDILQKKKELAETDSALKKEEASLQRKKQSVEEEKKAAKRITNQAEKKEKLQRIADREKEIAAQEKELSEKNKNTAEKALQIEAAEKQTEQLEEAAKKKEESIARKEKDLITDKKEIERDELKETIRKDPEKAEEILDAKAEELEKKEDALDRREDTLREETDKNVFAEKFYYLKISEYLDGGHYNNHLYMINAAERRVEFESPVKNICGRRYDIFSGGIVVITHKGRHKSGHHLTLIDRETLKEKKTGTENIFWRSFVEIRDNHIYAIIRNNDTEKHYLGKFNTDLELEAKSETEIDNDTFITFYRDSIYINRYDKKIAVLKENDLSEAEIIAP